MHSSQNVFLIRLQSHRRDALRNRFLFLRGVEISASLALPHGYTLVNGYLSKRVARNTELFAGVDNLFNDDANAAYGNNEGSGAMGTYYYGGVTFRL